MEKQNLNNTSIIKNVSYNQKEILYNIMQLHNNGQAFDADLTASTLKFYKNKKNDVFNVPEPKYLFDVYPQLDKIQKIEPFKKIPLPDGSLKSIVVDLPFLISPKTSASIKENKNGSNIISKRFSSFYPAQELFDTIYWNLLECYRLLDDNGIVVWKMQSTVSGGRQIWSVPFSFMAAESLGFYPVDEFVLLAKSRLISASKYKQQVHARKYTSSFLVFRKTNKHQDVNLFECLEKCKSDVFEGKVYELK